MAAALDWLQTFLAAVLGFVAAKGHSQIRLAGRIRSALLEEVQILKDMPDGAARDELRAHVDYRVRMLIAEDDRGDAVERLKTRWAWSYIAMGFLIPLIFLKDLDSAEPGATVPVLIGLGLGLGAFMYGLYQLIEIRRKRNERKFNHHTEADISRATRSAGSA